MRIAVIGTGYVGLVSGACFSEFGVEVTCVDKDAAKIARLNRGEMPIYEPGLEQVVATNSAAGRLRFTSDLAGAVDGADAVFIAVGTPSRRGDGHADLSYVFAAADEIAAALTGYAVVVTKSTVPVGTGRKVAEIVRRRRPEGSFDVASNPEFLREGSAIEDFMRPDQVVIGAESERARAVLRGLYRPLFLLETPILFTALETAELIKYAANSFLATKIQFINEIADLCERVGADVQEVAKGIGLDGRIGRKFLHAGPGFGGSCFPKDCLALARTAQEAGAPLGIVETVVAGNDRRKAQMAERVVARLRRQRRRQDRRGARPDLQAQHRRHARFAEPRHRAGADGGGRDRARLRSRGHGRGQEASAGHGVLRQRLRGDGGRARARHHHGMERVPRARPGAGESGPEDADHHRPAQHLPAPGDGGGGFLLFQHRPRGGRAVARRPQRAPWPAFERPR